MTTVSQAAPRDNLPPTPLSWRAAIALTIIGIAGTAYLLQSTIGLRGQALAGVVCFFGLVALFSTNLRTVNWRTIGWGFVLQIALALLVLKVGDRGRASRRQPAGTLTCLVQPRAVGGDGR